MVSSITRRTFVSAMAAAPIATPGLLRAQTSSKPVQIGIISDMTGPFRDSGGPGNKVAAQLAVEDFGGEVLGRPIEIIQADCQNNPDVAGSLAREWIDRLGVDVLADGGPSSAALVVQSIAAEKKRPYLIVGPASTAFTGPQCTAYGIQFVYDTYAQANSTGRALAKTGGESWFFITTDYTFGHSLEKDTTDTITKLGCKVVGSVKVPLNTTDFSSYLLQAQASGAKVLGLATAGTDLRNCIKQASEFGIVQSGMRLACLSMQIMDVIALGQKATAGAVYTDSFYWDLSDSTRDFTKRFVARYNLLPTPTLCQAGMYGAVTHWLKAVKATNSTDADGVVAAMKATPMNDMYNKDVRIREDGRVMHPMYLWQVKEESESKYEHDWVKLVARVEPEDAWRSLADGGCPLVKG
jgi:branched-chain amino acid transport system substrate-binding protein